MEGPDNAKKTCESSQSHYGNWSEKDKKDEKKREDFWQRRQKRLSIFSPNWTCESKYLSGLDLL